MNDEPEINLNDHPVDKLKEMLEGAGYEVDEGTMQEARDYLDEPIFWPDEIK